MKMNVIRKRLLPLAVAAAMCLGMVLPVAAADTATSIQVSETEGTVSVTNSRGRTLTLSKDMRLYNGYQVTTQKSSYAWLLLDDSKLAKQDAASEVEVRKDGKKLELLVNSGNLYFNVTKPLDSSETMNIRTSSMVTGVRGTCGWVESVDSGHSRVYVLEGTLVCQVTDPVSGQSRNATIHSGEVGNFYVYSQAQGGEYCGITTEKFSEDAISGFVLKELAGDSALCGKIQSASGLNVRAAAGKAQTRLAADEAAMNQRVDAAEQQAAGQASNISRNPVWNGEGGGSVEQSASASAEQLGKQLAQDSVSKVTIGGTAGAPETFTVDSNLNVPKGKTLSLGENVGLVVGKGATLSVAGTLNTAGDLTNNGTIDVTSGNTLRVEGQLVNSAGSTINNHSNGRIVATGGILNAGTIINSGNARIVSEGMATVRMQTGSSLRFSGGAITNEGGGYALLQEGSMTPAEAGTLLASTGSGIFYAKTDNVLGTVSGSGVYTTVYPKGYSAQLQPNSYYRIEKGVDSSGTQSSGGSTRTIYETVYVEVPSKYTLTFYLNGGEMVDGVPVRAGYTFAGWEYDSDQQPIGGSAPVSSNMTLRAQWTSGSGGGDESGCEIIFNENHVGAYTGPVEGPTWEGYTFLGWNTKPNGTGEWLGSGNLSVSGKAIYYAQWRRETSAEDTGDFIVTGGDYGDDYIYENGQLTIMSDAPLTIKNRNEYTATTDHIFVNAGVNADITLAGVYIDTSGLAEPKAAFQIADDSSGYGMVTLADDSWNELISGDGCAGLQKSSLQESAGMLVIGGSGRLVATGGAGAAGIGGGRNGNGDNIIIDGGIIDAEGGASGAGIGGGSGGSGSNITINGGTIEKAQGGDYAAGIGGGNGGNGGAAGDDHDDHITINGGIIKNAIGGVCAAGIGGGNAGDGGYGGDGYITINGGTIEKAVGGDYGAGIGGGEVGDGYITIDGGIIKNAIGGDGGAGIGGGCGAFGYGGSGHITINGGTINAAGGASVDSGDGGAGIGSGESGSGSYIEFVGGRIVASGSGQDNAPAGIGGSGDFSSIVFIGGMINGERATNYEDQVET